MSLDAWLTLILLLAMLTLLAWDRLPIWVVFVAGLTAAMTLRLAPTPDLLRGFGNTGVLTVAALFPVAAGMYATGAISLLTQRILGSPRSEAAASRRILPAIALGSAFINNTPMVAMFMPVVRDLRRQTGLVAPSLLMGISFASILGGNTTLIGGATNLIVAGMTADAIRAGELPGMQPIGMFELSLIGVPAAVAGLAYLIWVAPHLLRRVAADTVGPVPRPKYLCAFDVVPGSPLEGRTVEAAHLATLPERRLVSVRRDGVETDPAPGLVLRGGDRLTFAASAEAAADLWTSIGLVPAHGTLPGDTRQHHRLVEVVVAARAAAVGRPVADLPAPESGYRAMVLGVSRHGDVPDVPDRRLGALRVAPGDGAMLEVDERFFDEARNESDFVLVKTWSGKRVKRVDRAVLATLVTVAMIALAASSAISMLNAALLAGLAMLLTGCLTAEQALDSIQWTTIAVLGAALGLEAAISESGLSEAIARLCTSLGGSSPTAALGVVFAATIVMTNLISNSAAAAFMFPVALSITQMLGVSFKPFAMVIMVASSCAFINPAGFQTNMMVQREGGYGFRDFVRVGTPLTLIEGAVVLSLAPLVYGF